MNSKNIHSPFLAAASALCLMVPPLWADTFGEFTYTDDGTSITITDYPESATGDVVIPETIIAKPVTVIGNRAFSGCKGLTSISIPNSVTSIEFSAFFGCKGLTSISIPDGVTSIEYATFARCFSLTSFSIPNSVKSIGGFAFYQCTGLTSISIPNSVTRIDFDAFKACTGLTSVSIPNSVTSIGEKAFVKCTSLTTFTIPNSVKSIKARTFFGCDGLTSVSIPNSVTSIENNAFLFCDGLTSVSIPNSVTSIGHSSFENCLSLTSVSIPNSVTRIGYSAFEGCRSLTKATFLGSAPDIEHDLFEDTAPGFTVFFFEGESGFTLPTWKGYPSVAIVGVPEISVQDSAGNKLLDGTSKKSFGTVVVDQSGTAKTFTIKNTGTAILKNLSITKDGANVTNFDVTDPVKTSLARNATTTFKVTFKPSDSGTRHASIHITGDDLNKNPFDFKLTGEGAAP